MMKNDQLKEEAITNKSGIFKACPGEPYGRGPKLSKFWNRPFNKAIIVLFAAWVVGGSVGVFFKWLWGGYG